MLSAFEALRLPGAKLTTADRRIVADQLDGIAECVRQNMSRGGIVLAIPARAPNVLGEILRVLRENGWIPNVEPIPSEIHGAPSSQLKLALSPNEAAYKQLAETERAEELQSLQ